MQQNTLNTEFNGNLFAKLTIGLFTLVNIIIKVYLNVKYHSSSGKLVEKLEIN